MILLVGSEGNMGKRYKSILQFLSVGYINYDIKNGYEEPDMDGVTHVIVATPTEKHTDSISDYLHLNVPILCEKPICKDVKELKVLFKYIDKRKLDLTMMYQYKYMIREKNVYGYTCYDYFKHGNDGLVWDCLQIIGLAKGKIELNEESPVWNCVINGEKLEIQRMDMAYVDFVNDWLRGGCRYGSKELIRIHEKAYRMEK